MSRARIEGGVWLRRVTWSSNGVWRTDMFKSVLADERLRFAEFRLKGGPVVQIPKGELQRVLAGGPDHYENQIWGPFNIDPRARTLADVRVEMHVETQEQSR